jgi:branched-chain amino acid transport system permease protein
LAWTLALATVVAFTAVSLIGLNLIYGLTGMLSLGQAAFAAWPVYVASILHNSGVPWAIAIPLAVLVSVAIARTIGSIFIRLPGIYFAIGTLGFAFVTEGLARAFPGITGGASGLAPVIVRTLCDTLVGLKGRFAMILVEQNRAFLEGVADRILEMRSGQLVEVYAKSKVENSAAAKDHANLA